MVENSRNICQIISIHSSAYIRYSPIHTLQGTNEPAEKPKSSTKRGGGHLQAAWIAQVCAEGAFQSCLAQNKTKTMIKIKNMKSKPDLAKKKQKLSKPQHQKQNHETENQKPTKKRRNNQKWKKRQKNTKKKTKKKSDAIRRINWFSDV